MIEVSLVSIALLLGVTVVAVALLKRLQVPAVIGYLAVGLLVGPHLFGWVDAGSSQLAEFGVVLLLFTLGLEFSLPRLISMRREVLVLGGSQVLITLLVAPLVAPLVGIGTETAIVLGAVFAMSSTAIATKQLAEQTELNLPHGRLAFGVLLFQDLAVVPLLILIPAVGGDVGSIGAAVARAVVEGGLAVAFVLVAGRFLMRPLFHEIARAESAELFTLTVLLITVGCAAITHALGLSAALGAFLGGMMLAETEFRHQVEADIRPFRDVLLGAFFVSIGTLLDPAAIAGHWLWVLVGLGFVVGFKAVLVALLARGFTDGWNPAWRTGLTLAQGGEFGFALLALALAHAVVRPETAQVALGTIVLSMVIAPFLIRYNGTLAARLASPSDAATREVLAHDVAAQPVHHSSHVLIVGFGRVGQNVARLLEQEGFDWVALDLDPHRIQAARAAGDPVYYGDATSPDVLRAAGVERARVLFISYYRVSVALKILAQVRKLRPDLPVLVRVRDDSRLDELMAAGATEVIPDTLEASLMVASHLLVLLTVPMTRVVRAINAVRNDRYALLRNVFRGQDARPIDASHAYREQLASVQLDDHARATGRTLGDLGLEGVVVTALRRDGIVGRQPGPATQLRAGDVVVLYGKPEDLERAEEQLLGG